VLQRFDQDTLRDKLSGVKDMPVKIVINCKNSKRKPSKPKRMEEDRRMGQMNDFEYD
jgi:hypothetical protein